MNLSKISLILKGTGMGIAEVIPGVSGGTIAFITGIYHELINCIKAFDIEMLTMIKKGQFKKAVEKINPGFLIWLMIGMVAGILIGILFISHMLETYPEVLWAAFFALILASIPYMIRSLKSPSWKLIPVFIVALLLAYMITRLTPVSASENYLYIFFGGMVAIVALVLPGISGSFILLLLGLYTLIIPTLKNFLSDPGYDEFKILSFFALGCIAGLVVFSRLVSAAFEIFHDTTVIAMTGFMIGSLNKIWPWRNPLTLLNKETGETIAFNTADHLASLGHEELKVLEETNVLPSEYVGDPHTTIVIVVFFVFTVLVFAMSRFAKKL